MRISAAQTPSFMKTSSNNVTNSLNVDILLHNLKQDIALQTKPEREDQRGSDHFPVTTTINVQATRRPPEHRIPKTMLTSKPAAEEAKQRHAATMPMLAIALRESTEDNFRNTVQSVEQEIKESWTSRVKTRHRDHPVPWWTGELARKKMLAHKTFLQWRRAQGNPALNRQMHATQKEYKREKRRAHACFVRRHIDNIQRAPTTETAMAAKRDLRGRKKREANDKRRGEQLEPRKFTSFMANVGNAGVVQQLAPFGGFDESLIPEDPEDHITKAITRMEPNKAVGQDGIHVEMLKIQRKAVEKTLKEMWKAIGRTGQIPTNWTRGTLIPVHKKGVQRETGNYRPLAMLSHVRKVLEKAYVYVLDKYFETDEAQFGFQDGLNILQAVLEVEIARRRGAQFFAILDLKKANDKLIRLILKRKLDKVLPAPILNQLVVFLVAVEMSTAGDYTGHTTKSKTGLNQGGAISPTFYRVFINDLPARIRSRNANDTLDPALTAKIVADDVIMATRKAEAMKAKLDESSDWAEEDHAEWAPDKCLIMCMRNEDMVTEQFKLAEQTLKNVTEGEYLGLNYTRRGFEEKAHQVLLQKGQAGIRELNGNAWFNAGLTPAATRSLYHTYIRSRIVYGVIVCKTGDTTCQVDSQILAEYFKALLKLRVPLSHKKTERLCLLYGIHSLEDELAKQATIFVRRLNRTRAEGHTEKLKHHAKRSLNALSEIGTDIVCGGLRLERNETWQQRLEWRYDCRREHEGSNTPNSRKPRRRATWKEDESVLVDERLGEKRRNAIARWFVRRFPITPADQEQEATLERLKRWNSLSREEKTSTIDTIDRKIEEDEKDWRRKQARASG